MTEAPRAILLAGGKGTRLHPYTAVFPKPLLPLGDEPVVARLIRQLSAHGIRDITLALGHHGALIRAYFSQDNIVAPELTLRFVDENSPTGTAGAIANISGLDDTFLVMNGDLLTDLDFGALLAAHRESNAALTVATYGRSVQIDFGVVHTDDSGCIVGYDEKPEFDYRVSMGVYVYEPRVLPLIEAGAYLDFPDLVLRLIERGEIVRSFLWQGLWLDIGRPSDYAEAQRLIESGVNP